MAQNERVTEYLLIVLIAVTLLTAVPLSLRGQKVPAVEWGDAATKSVLTTFVFGWILSFDLLIQKRVVERKSYAVLLPGFCLLYLGSLLGFLEEMYTFTLFWQVLENTTLILGAILTALGVYLYVKVLQRVYREMMFFRDTLVNDIGNLGQIGLGYLHILQGLGIDETKEVEEGMRAAIKKTSRISESVEALKEIRETSLQKYSLNESLERSIRKIKEYCKKEIDVTLAMEKGCYVRANEFLDTMFFNFFEAMLEETLRDRVRLDIRVEKTHGTCDIRIHNRDLTLSESRKEEILKSLERPSQNTYLRLYVAKRILDHFDGTFTLHDVEEGTKITARLPDAD